MGTKIGNIIPTKEKTPKEILEKLFRDEYENDDTKTDIDKLILLMEIVIDQLDDLKDHSHSFNTNY